MQLVESLNFAEADSMDIKALMGIYKTIIRNNKSRSVKARLPRNSDVSLILKLQ